VGAAKRLSYLAAVSGLTVRRSPCEQRMNGRNEEANVPKFMFIFRGGAQEYPDLSPTEMQEHLKKWYAWAGELARAGRHSGGQPLDNGGKTMRGRDRIVTDGPYAESKDLVTGSLVLQAASLDEAVELARECPVFDFGGSVEVRPVIEHEV
jgi:hypothetical protein